MGRTRRYEILGTPQKETDLESVRIRGKRVRQGMKIWINVGPPHSKIIEDRVKRIYKHTSANWGTERTIRIGVDDIAVKYIRGIKILDKKPVSTKEVAQLGRHFPSGDRESLGKMTRKISWMKQNR